MKKLVLETTAPFQGLPELVADAEGLFEREGLAIEWVERDSADKSTDVNVTGPKGLNPFSSHGLMLEQGKADMYNACEWGNYCRVQETQVGSRQVGRRGIVSYAAIVVRPDSPVFTGQQLAGRTVGVPFYFGTHYLALHLLEGFMRRRVKVGAQGTSPALVGWLQSNARAHLHRARDNAAPRRTAPKIGSSALLRPG